MSKSLAKTMKKEGELCRKIVKAFYRNRCAMDIEGKTSKEGFEGYDLATATAGLVFQELFKGGRDPEYDPDEFLDEFYIQVGMGLPVWSVPSADADSLPLIN